MLTRQHLRVRPCAALWWHRMQRHLASCYCLCQARLPTCMPGWSVQMCSSPSRTRCLNGLPQGRCQTSVPEHCNHTCCVSSRTPRIQGLHVSPCCIQCTAGLPGGLAVCQMPDDASRAGSAMPDDVQQHCEALRGALGMATAAQTEQLRMFLQLHVATGNAPHLSDQCFLHPLPACMASAAITLP